MSTIKKTRSVIFDYGQQLGRSIMLPIAVLPVAGLFLGISAALSSGPVKAAYPVLANTTLQAVLLIMNAVGNGVFTALPLIFAIGIAVGLAKGEKGVAGLSAVVGFFAMNTTLNAILVITKVLPVAAGVDQRLLGIGSSYGILTLQMGTFAGILVGIITAIVHNKFYKTKLPDVLAFFGGSRFVPIVNTFVFVIVGAIMYFVWPPIGQSIASLGKWVANLGILGAFMYGLILRSFYIFGLHHVFYLPFWTTAVGGSLMVGGKMVDGFQNIFMAQLADPNTTQFFRNVALFNSGRYIHMLFTMPAICFAMYRAIPTKEKRRAAFGFIFSIAFTCLVTGVTEPISFALLFASPILFGMEVITFALGFVAAALANITIGSTFSAGLIEYFLFGVMQGNAKTNFLLVIVIGIPFAVLNYFAFKFVIEKLNLKTPGRDDEEITESEKNLSSNYDSSMAAAVINGLGGIANIVSIDNCATRLRVTVLDETKIEKGILKTTGANAVVIHGKQIQAIYGPKVINIRMDVDDYIASLNK